MADDSVATKSAEASARVADLELVSALWGGTTAMRKKRETYLPKHEAENADEYDVRLGSSFLFNMFKRSARFLAGKPFSKPIQVSDKLPAIAAAWVADIDNNGTDLAQWARRLFEKALRDGFRFIVVDVPKAVIPEGRDELSIAEEAEQGIRPYAIEVSAAQFLGARVERRRGVNVITQFRYSEQMLVPDGEFGEKAVQTVRVLMPGRTDVYVHKSGEGESGKYELDEKLSSTTSVDFVPVIPVVPDPVGPVTGQSPLLDLAWVNVEHWQSTSDQRNILHESRVPMKYAFGFANKDDIVVGANVVVTNPNPEAKFGFVEHTGKAIQSGKDDIEHLENRARVLGLSLMVERPSADITATEVKSNNAEADSELAAMARDFGADLGHMIDMMLEWIDEVPTGDPVVLHTNFAIPAAAAADMTALLKLRQAKEITQATFLNESKRRGFLGDDLDVDLEIAATSEEQIALALMASIDPDDDDDDDDDGDGDDEN